MVAQRRTFGIFSNNKGLPCPFKPILCQEGYCHGCQIYLDWQKRGEKGVVRSRVDFFMLPKVEAKDGTA